MKKTFLLPIIFCTTLLIAILVKLFIIDIVVVSGSSMYPTIKDGDVIFINKLEYGIVKPFSSSFIKQWKEPQKMML